MTVTDLIVVGGVLINIGIWFQTSRANTKSIETLTENLETHKQAIWPVLTEQGKGNLQHQGTPRNQRRQQRTRTPCLTSTP
jgi:hypothetical protein